MTEIIYNKAAAMKFTQLMKEIETIDSDINSLKQIALVCSKQTARAVVSLTVIDIEKYEALNDADVQAFLKENPPENGVGGLIMYPTMPEFMPPQFRSHHNVPPQLSKEQKEMRRKEQNAQRSTLSIDTEHYPSISLTIIAKIKQALLAKKEELQKEANQLYKQISEA